MLFSNLLEGKHGLQQIITVKHFGRWLWMGEAPLFFFCRDFLPLLLDVSVGWISMSPCCCQILQWRTHFAFKKGCCKFEQDNMDPSLTQTGLYCLSERIMGPLGSQWTVWGDKWSGKQSKPHLGNLFIYFNECVTNKRKNSLKVHLWVSACKRYNGWNILYININRDNYVMITLQQILKYIFTV